MYEGNWRNGTQHDPKGKVTYKSGLVKIFNYVDGKTISWYWIVKLLGWQLLQDSIFYDSY